MRTIPLALKSLFVVFCFAGVTTAYAQQTQNSTDIPRTFSYQGLLSGPNGVPVADGEYQITVSLYTDPNGTMKIWQDTYHTSVTGGIFNLYLGSQKMGLPDPATMNRPLWIGTQVGDAAETYPLTPLSASPYALNVADRAITTNKLADAAVTAEKVNMDYVGGIAVNGQSVTGNGTVLNIEGSDDIALTYNDETNTLHLSKPNPTTSDVSEKGSSTLGTTSDFWTMRGDGRTDDGGTVTPASGDWIGTSNAVTFEMRTNNQQVMRYQPSGTNTPNVIGGFSGNSITSASIGSVIAGGGASGAVNQISSSANYTVIGGGKNNTVSGNNSIIGSGESNNIAGLSSAITGGALNAINTGTEFAFIGGGSENTIGSNSYWSTIAGGHGNATTSSHAFIGSGHFNLVTGENAAIGGGRINLVSGFDAFIGAGDANMAAGDYAFVGAGQANQSDGDFSAIAGGDSNTVTGANSVIGGGTRNTIDAGADRSMIGSGIDNEIHDNTTYSFVGSGLENQIMEGITSSAIGSGDQNTISASYGFIGGGLYNTVSSQGGVIGGGTINAASNTYAFVGSGSSNTASGSESFVGSGNGNLASGHYAAVAAGFENVATATSAFIGAGNDNIASGNYSVLAGGYFNKALNTNATIGGGRYNTAAGDNAFIGGGDSNTALNTNATIGGGSYNTVAGDNAFIGGGNGNSATAIYDFIGAGRSNATSDEYATIVGGEGNIASNLYSFVGNGYYNTSSNLHSFVGNGIYNIASGAYAAVGSGTVNHAIGQASFIGAGENNTATGSFSVVAAGRDNTAFGYKSAVGGGGHNITTASYSTIPGGDSLQATEYAQTSIGFFNAPRGTLAAQPFTPTLRVTNDPLFMIGNGTAAAPGGSIIHSNAFEVSYNGHSVVYDVNGTSQTMVLGSRAPIKGATYVDNVVYAWGDINANGTVNADFGVANVVNIGLGSYIVTLRLVDPQTGAPVTLLNGAVTATLTMLGNAAPCGMIVCSRIGNPAANQFQVRTYGPTCSPVDLSFMFHVTGRP